MNDIETLIDRLTDRQRHEFALACARRVQHLMTDPRGNATVREPGWAARNAVWIAEAAAWLAESDAERNAERAWQREELERMLGGDA
jgi:hypothetical protein